jgi:hypothetical protein
MHLWTWPLAKNQQFPLAAGPVKKTSCIQVLGAPAGDFSESMQGLTPGAFGLYRIIRKS